MRAAAAAAGKRNRVGIYIVVPAVKYVYSRIAQIHRRVQDCSASVMTNCLVAKGEMYELDTLGSVRRCRYIIQPLGAKQRCELAAHGLARQWQEARLGTFRGHQRNRQGVHD